MTYHSPLVMVAIGLLGDEADRNQLDARRRPSAVGGLPTPSGVFLARSIPNDTLPEMLCHPVPEQNHAE